MTAGDKEGLENSLIQAIEQKAGHPEYRAGRKSIYDELERLLPEKEYPLVLSIIDQGYSLLEDEPITDQIAKEVRNFSKHINSLVEEKHKEFEERYPEWFNDNIKLQVQVTHPLNHPPSKQMVQKGKNTIMVQLSEYLRPYFTTKTGIAEMIAQIFIYFYGRDYPEIDPKKISSLI